MFNLIKANQSSGGEHARELLSIFVVHLFPSFLNIEAAVQKLGGFGVGHDFSAQMSWVGLFGKPFHIRKVHLEGLIIHIPPKEKRDQGEKAPEQTSAEKPKKKTKDIPVLVDELVSDNAELVLVPGDPRKDPHVFEIHRLVMHSVGLGHSAAFEAELTNATPPGEIHTKGHFGPWQIDDPGQTPLSADYTFKDADLSVFHVGADAFSNVAIKLFERRSLPFRRRLHDLCIHRVQFAVIRNVELNGRSRAIAVEHVPRALSARRTRPRELSGVRARHC